MAVDLAAVVRGYVERMLREVPGMKALLLDAETTQIVSTVYSQSEILEQEVYLVERLDAESNDQLLHLKVSEPKALELLVRRVLTVVEGWRLASLAECTGCQPIYCSSQLFLLDRRSAF